MTTHLKCLSVVVESIAAHSEDIAMARLYGVLTPRKGITDVCLRNHSAKQVILPKQTAVGEITAANIIPALVVPKPTGQETGKVRLLLEKGNMKVKNNYWTKLT